MKVSNLKKHLTLSALFAAGTILSGTAFADDISTGSDLATIIAADSPDTRTGTLTTNITATANLGLLVGKELTINGGENKYGISGSYGTNGHYEGISVDTAQTLIIKNVGSVSDTGIIINSWNGFALIASDDAFSKEGGAICSYEGVVTIEDSIFSTNYISTIGTNDSEAYLEGGAIYSFAGEVTIKNSTFYNNYAEAVNNAQSSAGGAIYFHEGPLTINNSNFSNNYASSIGTNDDGASASGGAICSHYKGAMDITDSSFSNNYAKATSQYSDSAANAQAYGGAIRGGSSDMATITGSTFSENYAEATSQYSKAEAKGGAIFNGYGNIMTITGSIFSENYAEATTTTVSDYEALASGGAIHNDNNAIVTITDSTFSGNYAEATSQYTEAEANGGAIFNGSGTANIIASTKDSVFSGNKVIVNGTETKNDIYNSGTTNLYAASGKTISFDGGIGGKEYESTVNINVQGTTTYGVAGTVLFKNASVNSDNDFTLGAGTLKIEEGVTWTNNTLAMNGGTLDIRNAGTLNYDGGSLTLNDGADIHINISEAGNDQIVFSKDAEFILNGGKITVDLNKSVSAGEEFEILTDFILGDSSQDLSTLVVEVANTPGYVLAASTIAGTGSTNSLLLTVAAIPEPSMFGLFAGLAALALVGTRRRRK